jgi:hypothetical protein
VSASSVLRVLLEHGRVLPYRPPRGRSVKRPWPDWVDYTPRQVWGYEGYGQHNRQLRRWRGQRLTDAQRREIARLEGVARDLRLVLTQVLELADELGEGTIERQLAKSDLELGLEYVLRSDPRA